MYTLTPGTLTAAAFTACFGSVALAIPAVLSGWGSAEVVAGFAASAVFLVLFILAERRSAAPLLRLDRGSGRPGPRDAP